MRLIHKKGEIKFVLRFSKLTLCFLLFNSILFSQNSTITGIVTGDNGSPLSGVSVTVKGTSRGTTTGNSGSYSIAAPADATLLFSAVGFTDKSEPVNGRTDISVVLATSTRELEQVVVVGYGTQRRRDITGAVASVKGADIARQPVVTPTQAIQGKVAGVQIISSGAPNSAPIVRIRGTGSVLGGQDPLYVVDGIITNDIRNLNTADIVSLDVLKDASAATIYGVRAANGVILITTKKGRSGRMVVSYDASIGMRQAGHLVKMANAEQYATYINEASVNTGNGAILVDPAATSTSTDWYATILRKAFWQNHNVSISGGSDKINYFFSANYLTDEGIVLNNNFKRYSLRSNNDYKLSDKLKLTILSSYSKGVTQDVNLGAAYNNAYHAAPIIPSKINGRYGNTSAYQNVGNPLLDIENNDNQLNENRLQFNGAIDYKPVSWLTLRTSYGVDLAFNNRRVYNYAFANDTTTFLVAGGNQQSVKSALYFGNENLYHWVWDNTATIQKSFGVNDVTFLVGTSAEKQSVNQTLGSRVDVPADPNLWYLNQGDPASQSNSSGADLFARNSYLSRLNYSYDKRYLLTATFRADGSSKFNKKWGYFPAVGLGWNITNENFMKSQTTFTYLKLRGSYGKLGNDAISSNARFQTLNGGIPYFFGGALQSGIQFGSNVDQGIYWESTTQSDIGLEFSILKGRLTGEIDLYDKKVNNALIQVRTQATASTGAPTSNPLILTNLASFKNSGIELSLSYNNGQGKRISYSISGNASFNNNKIIGLNRGQPIVAGGVGSAGNTTLTTNNQPVGAFYLLQADGVFHNQGELAAYVTKGGNPITINGQPPQLGDLRYKDINDDGKIDDNDRAFSGSYQPKVTLGLNTSVSYKQFDLNLTAYGTLGSKIYNGKKEARFNQRDNVEAKVAEDRWTFTNYASNVPRANLNALPHSTYFLENGNFARINNLTIGYTLPHSTLSKIGVGTFRVYLTAQNLVTITKYSGFTPELASGDPLSQGIEYNAYPTTRTIAFGVNLTF